MDTPTSLKRRRPYLPDEAIPGSYHQPSNLPLSNGMIASFPPHHRAVLHQAAEILELDVHQLPLLGPQHYKDFVIDQAANYFKLSGQELSELVQLYTAPYRNKRQRQSVDSALGQSFENNVEQIEMEKTRAFVNALPGHVSEAGRRSFFSLSSPSTSTGQSLICASTSGLADCLTGLATCQTSPSRTNGGAEYQALPTPVEYPSQYADDRDRSAGVQPCAERNLNEPYMDGGVGPLINLEWTNENGMTSMPFVGSYPALQSSDMGLMNEQLANLQPYAHSESMYYPGAEQQNATLLKEHIETHVQVQAISQAMPTLPTCQPTLQMTQLPTYNGDAGFLAVDSPASSGAGVLTTGIAAFVETTSNDLPAYTTDCTADAELHGSGRGDYDNDTSTSCDAVFGCDNPTAAATNAPNANSHQALLDIKSPTKEFIGPLPPGVTMPQPQYMPIDSQGVIQHHHHHLQNRPPSSSPATGPGLDLTSQRHPRPTAARRGPFKDNNDRQKTAQTRKIGSCVRCRMQRIRCNADPANVTGECLCCKRAASKIWRLPCMRLKISDVTLSKTCQVKGYEWTLRWKENSILDTIGHWASSETRIIRVTEGYTGEYVELRVRKFIPQDGDRLERSWFTPDGEKRSVTIPPYAVVEPESIGPQYSAYIKKGLLACFHQVLGQQKNTLIWPTYVTALKLARHGNHLAELERHVLNNTLDLWMAVRLTTRSFEIIGDDTLGMPRNILDETNPSCGKIPIPPVMGAQLDSVLINNIQTLLRKRALEGLHKLTTENKARSWFTTYLVTFILLHNASLIIKHDASYARKHGMNRRFAREEKVQEYYTGAITLLAYFHYCNKGVFPFSKGSRDQDLRNLANLDEEAMGFVFKTRAFAISNQAHWKSLWDNNDYEDEFYFISQLYEVNWQPRRMVF